MVLECGLGGVVAVVWLGCGSCGVVAVVWLEGR